MRAWMIFTLAAILWPPPAQDKEEAAATTAQRYASRGVVLLVDEEKGLLAYSQVSGKWVAAPIKLKAGDARKLSPALTDNVAVVELDDRVAAFSAPRSRWAVQEAKQGAKPKTTINAGDLVLVEIGDELFAFSPNTGRFAMAGGDANPALGQSAPELGAVVYYGRGSGYAASGGSGPARERASQVFDAEQAEFHRTAADLRNRLERLETLIRQRDAQRTAIIERRLKAGSRATGLPPKGDGDPLRVDSSLSNSEMQHPSWRSKRRLAGDELRFAVMQELEKYEEIQSKYTEKHPLVADAKSWLTQQLPALKLESRRAELDYRAAEMELAHADRKLDYAKRMVDKGFVTNQALESAEFELERKKLDVERVGLEYRDWRVLEDKVRRAVTPPEAVEGKTDTSKTK